MTKPTGDSGARPVLLFVEDHADSRAMYAEFLGDRFEILEAADGNAAWDLLQQRTADVIVTDLALPGLDGFQLIERIRADARLRGIPIIALSGFTAPAPLDAQASWDVMLEKPCLPEQLAEAVTAAARKRSGA